MENSNNLEKGVASEDSSDSTKGKEGEFSISGPATAFNVNTAKLVSLLIGLLVLGGFFAYYYQVPLKNIISNPQSVQQVTGTGSSRMAGQLKKLDRDLQIFNQPTTEYERASYYEAGKFTQGEFKDYTRIIAVGPFNGPGQPATFILATKDFKTYVLDDPRGNTTKYPIDDWHNPYASLDKNKISSVKILDTYQPTEIGLNSDFALYENGLLVESFSTDKKDKDGNQINGTRLITDFSAYQKLPSPISGITIYFRPNALNLNTVSYMSQLSQAEQERFRLTQQYVVGDGEVVVVDSTGLPVRYLMTRPQNIKAYANNKEAYEKAVKIYQVEEKKYFNKEITTYPQSPKYVYPPTFTIEDSQIDNPNNLSFFKKYETAFPGACASSPVGRIVNVRDEDLEPLGSAFGVPLFKLKGADHPLHKLAYYSKISYYDQFPEGWSYSTPKPNMQEYANQNPLLFFKNYWNQWVALGEFDIALPGGCGKPVIYLYPPKPTEVSVSFQAPVSFAVDIPKYVDSWFVKANPDGALVDLKPELTVCEEIDTRRPGSEYAKKACEANSYPYLYWAGNIDSKNYARPTGGWVVAQKELGGFLENKLTEIGLNANEKNDFIGYWLTDMLKKNSPYYRISFAETAELNSLFPMNVTPKPDTTFRIFLDYSPLTEKPAQLPEPQNLRKIVRKGFTLVEWGGLKKY